MHDMQEIDLQPLSEALIQHGAFGRGSSHNNLTFEQFILNDVRLGSQYGTYHVNQYHQDIRQETLEVLNTLGPSFSAEERESFRAAVCRLQAKNWNRNANFKIFLFFNAGMIAMGSCLLSSNLPGATPAGYVLISLFAAKLLLDFVNYLASKREITKEEVQHEMDTFANYYSGFRISNEPRLAGELPPEDFQRGCAFNW